MPKNPTKQQGTTRRRVLRGAAAMGAAAAVAPLAPMIARAANKKLKIGYVTPVTGPLAFFAEADVYVVPQFRQAMANGINIGGTTYDVELITKDSQSNPNRASEVASDLILGEKVDFILAAHTPEEVAVSVLAEIVAARNGAELVRTRPAPAVPLRRLPVKAEDTAIDPICQMTVRTQDAVHTASWAGRTWYFCCAGCKTKFLAEPTRYGEQAAR